MPQRAFGQRTVYVLRVRAVCGAGEKGAAGGGRGCRRAWGAWCRARWARGAGRVARGCARCRRARLRVVPGVLGVAREVARGAGRVGHSTRGCACKLLNYPMRKHRSSRHLVHAFVVAREVVSFLACTTSRQERGARSLASGKRRAQPSAGQGRVQPRARREGRASAHRTEGAGLRARLRATRCPRVRLRSFFLPCEWMGPVETY